MKKHTRKNRKKSEKEKLKCYENSLGFLIEQTVETGEISLLEIQSRQENLNQLIPNVEIFKEIMVELIRNKEIDMDALKRERSEFIQDQTSDFQLNEMLLQLCEGKFSQQKIRKIEVYRIEDGNTVIFDNVLTEGGERKSIRCSNILVRILRNEE